MKKFILFARLHSWLFLALPAAASAQNTASYPNYVVIGAFAHQHNAVKFTEDAELNNFPARFEMNPNRNLYYVYVTTTYDSALAFSEALKLRRETKYFDTWVYHGGFGEMRLSDASRVQIRDIDPVTGRRIESVAGDQNPSRTHPKQAPIQQNRTGRTSGEQTRAHDSGLKSLNSASPGLNANANRNASRQENDQTSQDDQQPGIASVAAPRLPAAKSSGEKSLATDDQIRPDGAIAGNTQSKLPEENTPQPALTNTAPVKIYAKQEATTPLTSEEVVGKDFLFQLYRADNLVIVEGEVEAIDVEKSRRMATYQANTPVKVLMPSGKSKHVSFVSQVFGYRKMQREFDPASPSEDLYLDKGGNLVVPFELVRLQKGGSVRTWQP